MVYSKQVKTILIVPKLRPFSSDDCEAQDVEEIDKLCVEFYWKEKYQAQNNRTMVYPSINTNVQEYPRRTQNNANEDFIIQTGPDSKVVSSEGQVDMAVGSETANVAGDVGGSSELKQCPQCTLFNDPNAAMCDVCEYIFT